MTELTDKERARILKEFMQEHFPFNDLLKLGFFKKEMKNDFKSQAERVCTFFGYKEVYEYGKEEIRCHVSYAGDRPLSVNEKGSLVPEPFITVIPSIWDSI